MQSDFKSNHHFSNNNVEMTSSVLDSNHLWFVKIGDVNKISSETRVEHKAFGNQRPPELKGHHRKVVKLMCRDAGNIFKKELLSETNNDHAKLIEQRRRKSTRREHEIARNDQEKVIVDNSMMLVFHVPEQFRFRSVLDQHG